jgi:hypothetical protein
MEKPRFNWPDVDSSIEEIVQRQKNELLRLGRRIIPTLTPEDMLQPNDYPELENHPEFRYEEGVLAGMQTIQMALRAGLSAPQDKRDIQDLHD